MRGASMLFEMTNFEFSVMRMVVAPTSVVIPTRFRPPQVIHEKFACRLRTNPFKPFDLRNSLTLLSFSLISSEIGIVSPKFTGNNGILEWWKNGRLEKQNLGMI